MVGRVHVRATPLALAAILLWVAFFLAPALRPGRALLGVDLIYRFPPWEAAVGDDWEAANFNLFDQAAQFYPWRLLTRRLQSAGLPPLWNPDAGTGSPLLANQQSATLAPVELVVSGIDPRRAPGVAAAIRLLIAGAGMFFLARELGVSAPAGVFAALAFLGSGSIAILLYHPNSNASTWLPLAALLSWRLGRGGGLRVASLLALVLGVQLLGGHPETSLYVALASILFFTLSFLTVGRGAGALRFGLRPWLFLIAAHGAGMALAAPQTLPFLEYLREGAVLGARGGERFFNPPICSAGILVPELFGTPDRPNTYFGPRNYHAMATQYAGLATVILALVGIAAAATRDARRAEPGRGAQPGNRLLVFGLALTAFLSLLLVYPTPVWRLAGFLPPFRIAANVTGLTLLFVFTVSLLGAFGLDALRGASGSGSSTGGRTLRFLAIALAVGGCLALAAGTLLPLARERLLAIGAERLSERYAGVTHAKSMDYYLDRLPLVFGALRGMLIRTGVSGLALALLLGPGVRFARRTSALSLALPLACILHLALDLAHFGRGYVPAIHVEQVFPTTAEIDTLAHFPGIARVLPTGRAMPPNTLTAYGIEDFRVHDAVGSAAHRRFEEAMSAAPFLRRPLVSYQRGLLDVAGVNLIALEPSEELANPESSGFTVLERGAVTLFRNDRAWPRAFFCATGREAPSDSAAIAEVIAIGGGATLVPGEVLLTRAKSGHGVAGPSGWELVRRLYRRAASDVVPASLIREGAILAALNSGAIEIGHLTHTPLVVTAAITAPTAGWLVLLDQDFPGWEVQVDGRPALQRRAFGLFRAVPVPAGAHTVVWRYRPASFATGLALAFGAMAAIVVGLAVSEPSRIERQRTTARPPWVRP